MNYSDNSKVIATKERIDFLIQMVIWNVGLTTREKVKYIKDFNEVILTIEVQKGLGKAYKKAIETENSTQWKQNPIYNSNKELISNELKPVWNGNYASVNVAEGTTKDQLTISIISHTLPNLLETTSWYERMGAKVVYKRIIEFQSLFNEELAEDTFWWFIRDFEENNSKYIKVI